MDKPKNSKEMRWNWHVYTIWRIIRLYVDKKAFVDNRNNIHYSYWDKLKRVAHKKVMDHEESRRIFEDLYKPM